jgi:ATP-dependent RNA helicase DHX29
LLTVYNAYMAWKRIKNTPGANEYSFCRKNFLSPQSLLNIEDIKMQLLVSTVDAGLVKLDAEEQNLLKRCAPYFFFFLFFFFCKSLSNL